MKGLLNNELSVKTLRNLKDSMDNRIHEIYNQGYREGYKDGLEEATHRIVDKILMADEILERRTDER